MTAEVIRYYIVYELLCCSGMVICGYLTHYYLRLKLSLWFKYAMTLIATFNMWWMVANVIQWSMNQ